MSQPDPSSSHSNQAQQSGGVSLGAYNQIRHLDIGDVVAGDKITLNIYTGDAHPRTPAMRAALLHAYRSEVAARYAVWRRRYATLPMVVQAVVAAHREPEELTFVALRQAYAADAESSETAQPAAYTFTDLRDGLARYDHLLLLGPPGGGKTTALWRLALDLVEAGLAGDDSAPLPVFVRLGGLQPGQSLRDLLATDLTAPIFLEDAHGKNWRLDAHRVVAGLFDDLLHEGRVLLLWDGLNEVPRSRFAESARALDAFRLANPGRCEGAWNRSVTTCRADDYAQLREACDRNPYPVQDVILQGLDSATIRQVVIRLLGDGKGAALLDALNQPEHAALAGLARTPLLLTMLCTVYQAADTLPRNRGQLLKNFVAQRWAWEHQRNPEGWIPAAVQESALARLAYVITESAGRGTSVPRAFAEKHLRASGGVADPADLVRLARSADLLEPLADGAQVRFTHQLVQEYFAAVALRGKLQQADGWHTLPVLGGAAKRLLVRRYARPGARTNWEETLLLLAGIDGEGSLAQELIRAFLGDPVRAAQLILASDLPPSPELETEIREGLTALVRDEAQTQNRRRAAGSLSTQLQHPYIPTTRAAWQREFQRRNARFGAPDGYFCYLPAGRYRIGGWEKGEPTADHDVAAFWVARLPVTVAQYAPFVAEGYGKDAEHWWTTAGWQWKQAQQRTKPWGWNDAKYSGANQPVIGVTWYEATAYCAWLSAQVAAPGYAVRLPTEAEWEVAAAYDGSMTHRTYPWGEKEATPERAVYDAWKLDAPAPVGLCPAGAAACGALDVVGNVWEWTTSSYEGYPAQSDTLVKDFTVSDVPLRGGTWYDSSTYVRCGARFRFPPDSGNLNYGVRVVVSPRSHKGSDF